MTKIDITCLGDLTTSYLEVPDQTSNGIEKALRPLTREEAEQMTPEQLEDRMLQFRAALNWLEAK